MSPCPVFLGSETQIQLDFGSAFFQHFLKFMHGFDWELLSQSSGLGKQSETLFNSI